jgi:hypothetical protein
VAFRVAADPEDPLRISFQSPIWKSCATRRVPGFRASIIGLELVQSGKGERDDRRVGEIAWVMSSWRISARSATPALGAVAASAQAGCAGSHARAPDLLAA